MAPTFEEMLECATTDSYEPEGPIATEGALARKTARMV